MAEFIKSSRNGTLLVFQNFYYRCKYTKGNIKYWRCQNKKCSATGITENERIIRINSQHEHGPPKKELSHKIFKNNLKEDARANIGVPIPTLYK